MQTIWKKRDAVSAPALALPLIVGHTQRAAGSGCATEALAGISIAHGLGLRSGFQRNPRKRKCPSDQHPPSRGWEVCGSFVKPSQPLRSSFAGRSVGIYADCPFHEQGAAMAAARQL